MDANKRNSPSKGHNVNGMDKAKAFFRPRGYRFKGACRCTRQKRCPQHGGNASRNARVTRDRDDSVTVTVTALKPGSRFCLCRTCSERFSGERNFDGHRVGPWADRRCQTVRELWDSGLRQNTKGIWYRPK